MRSIIRKICVVTGTRAEYGLLYWVMREIESEPLFELQIITTGMHLSPEFGLTYRAIEEDGFTINNKVEMLLSSDTPVGIAKSIGLGTIGFADAYNLLQPDLIIILGDRFEMLAAAQSALVARIPLAHIAGGDSTEGAYDEAFRHSITKMAHLHFTTNEISANRVRQMGENPEYIYNVGSPGLDYIHNTELLSRREIEELLGYKFEKINLLITFHPVTLSYQSSLDQLNELFCALEKITNEFGLIFTVPNADNEGRALTKVIKVFVEKNPNARFFTSLGQQLYLSLMAQVDAVVGNSSSGLYEAPSFKVPTVNIGDRQKGRLRAESVIDCEPSCEKILKALHKAFQMNCSDVKNPYGDGRSSRRIVEVMKAVPDYNKLVQKKFFDLE